MGELQGVGVAVSATSVRKVLLEDGLQPAPDRTRSSWREFLRAQAASMLACDFLTVDTIFLQRIYVLFFISLATRRIEYIACTSNPDGRWAAQQARNLTMQLGDEPPFRFLIHDRDSKFSQAFGEVFRTQRHHGDPDTGSGSERERLRRALGPHCPRRLSRPGPDPRRRHLESCSASTALITTSTGRTGPFAFCHPTAATRRR